MSNFYCETCGAVCQDTRFGYITGCKHYPPDAFAIEQGIADNDPYLVALAEIILAGQQNKKQIRTVYQEAERRNG